MIGEDGDATTLTLPVIFEALDGAQYQAFYYFTLNANGEAEAGGLYGQFDAGTSQIDEAAGGTVYPEVFEAISGEWLLSDDVGFAVDGDWGVDFLPLESGTEWFLLLTGTTFTGMSDVVYQVEVAP